MQSLLFIALGGALGALGRFWTGLAATALFGGRFPVGTLCVNVAGSFLIGLGPPIKFFLLRRPEG